MEGSHNEGIVVNEVFVEIPKAQEGSEFFDWSGLRPFGDSFNFDYVTTKSLDSNSRHTKMIS